MEGERRALPLGRCGKWVTRTMFLRTANTRSAVLEHPAATAPLVRETWGVHMPAKTHDARAHAIERARNKRLMDEWTMDSRGYDILSINYLSIWLKFSLGFSIYINYILFRRTGVGAHGYTRRLHATSGTLLKGVVRVYAFIDECSGTRSQYFHLIIRGAEHRYI